LFTHLSSRVHARTALASLVLRGSRFSIPANVRWSPVPSPPPLPDQVEQLPFDSCLTGWLTASRIRTPRASCTALCGNEAGLGRNRRCASPPPARKVLVAAPTPTRSPLSPDAMPSRLMGRAPLLNPRRPQGTQSSAVNSPGSGHSRRGSWHHRQQRCARFPNLRQSALMRPMMASFAGAAAARTAPPQESRGTWSTPERVDQCVRIDDRCPPTCYLSLRGWEHETVTKLRCNSSSGRHQKPASNTLWNRYDVLADHVPVRRPENRLNIRNALVGTRLRSGVLQRVPSTYMDVFRVIGTGHSTSPTSSARLIIAAAHRRLADHLVASARGLDDSGCAR